MLFGHTVLNVLIYFSWQSHQLLKLANKWYLSALCFVTSHMLENTWMQMVLIVTSAFIVSGHAHRYSSSVGLMSYYSSLHHICIIKWAFLLFLLLLMIKDCNLVAQHLRTSWLQINRLFLFVSEKVNVDKNAILSLLAPARDPVVPN